MAFTGRLQLIRILTLCNVTGCGAVLLFSLYLNKDVIWILKVYNLKIHLYGIISGLKQCETSKG